MTNVEMPLDFIITLKFIEIYLNIYHNQFPVKSQRHHFCVLPGFQKETLSDFYNDFNGESMLLKVRLTSFGKAEFYILFLNEILLLPQYFDSAVKTEFRASFAGH